MSTDKTTTKIVAKKMRINKQLEKCEIWEITQNMQCARYKRRGTTQNASQCIRYFISFKFFFFRLYFFFLCWKASRVWVWWHNFRVKMMKLNIVQRIKGWRNAIDFQVHLKLLSLYEDKDESYTASNMDGACISRAHFFL